MKPYFQLKFQIIMVAVAMSALQVRPDIQESTPAKSSITGSGDELLPGGFIIKSRPISFNQERIDLTLAYRRIHQDSQARDILIQPRMIILHWTGLNSLESSWNYFNRPRAETARPDLAAAGDVNVSAHFLVDRDGTIYRLMPETWMARHCIGLNHLAVGIENVGDGWKFPLTDAQVKSNAALVRYLKAKFPIDYLIGHMEYRRLEGTALFLEREPHYRNNKPDPGRDFMIKVRKLVEDLKLRQPSAAVDKKGSAHTQVTLPFHRARTDNA